MLPRDTQAALVRGKTLLARGDIEAAAALLERTLAHATRLGMVMHEARILAASPKPALNASRPSLVPVLVKACLMPRSRSYRSQEANPTTVRETRMCRARPAAAAGNGVGRLRGKRGRASGSGDEAHGAAIASGAHAAAVGSQRRANRGLRSHRVAPRVLTLASRTMRWPLAREMLVPCTCCAWHCAHRDD